MGRMITRIVSGVVVAIGSELMRRRTGQRFRQLRRCGEREANGTTFLPINLCRSRTPVHHACEQPHGCACYHSTLDHPLISRSVREVFSFVSRPLAIPDRFPSLARAHLESLGTAIALTHMLAILKVGMQTIVAMA